VIEGLAEIEPTVALTLFVKAPGTEPAVNRPLPLTEPPAEVVQVGLIGITRPSPSYPIAVICCVPSALIDAFGVTAIRVRLPGAVTPCTSHAEVITPTSRTASNARAATLLARNAPNIRFLNDGLIILRVSSYLHEGGTGTAIPYRAATVNDWLSVMVIGAPGATMMSR